MARSAANALSNIMKVIEVGERDAREIKIDDVMKNPISCGYLLDYCQRSYCAENLNFFMAVDKFKDECALLDFREPEAVKTVKEMADKIFSDYLSLNSPNEVSLPSEDRDVTMKRMESPGEWKGRLFDAALQDAIKTLHKDTLMRFIKSPQYSEMATTVRRVTEMIKNKELETEGAFQLEMPRSTELTEDKIMNGGNDYSLDEILSDCILFPEMLDYLEKKFKAENLKCARQIRRFEELWKEKKEEDLKEFSWNIYLFFIAPNSPFEVSCTSLDRKSVQQGLGCPNRTMFKPVMDNTMLVLKQDHKAFCNQINPKSLRDKLRHFKRKGSVSGGGLTSMAKGSGLMSFFARK